MKNDGGYPTIVEFAGLPKSGKTTSASGLKRFLESKGKNVYLVQERASLCPTTSKLHPDFNLWTSLSFLRELIVAKSTKCDYVIADRGLFDASIWINLFCAEQQHPAELLAFQQIENLDFFANISKKVFFFYCDINVALEREFERTQVHRAGQIMNREILQNYLQAYENISSKHEHARIDTTSLSISDMLKDVYEYFDLG